MHLRYGDSNTLFKHDVALHSVDVAMQAVLQAAVTENMVIPSFARRRVIFVSAVAH